jgi:CubicO group peptidase (beta-lactamase class C family)
MPEVLGTCEPAFVAVRDEFERNFVERGEVGASVCITVDGNAVVDLWGGVADPATGRAWAEDTVGVVWSCTKGAVALCAHMLAARGALDLNAAVTDYWPEFGKNGKETMPVRYLLAHQAGLAAFREPIPDGAFCNWDFIVDTLAAQEPLWEPGTRNGYHALTFGHLVGEVVRRVSGRTVGAFFAEEIAGPLGLDFWIGLPESVEPRVAPTIPADPPGPGDPLPTFYTAGLTDPTSVAAMVLMNSGGLLFPGVIDTREHHAAEIPAANGITNGRGLAGMYAALANGGGSLVPADAIPAMGRVVSATSQDATMLVPTRWGLGFHGAMDNRHLPPPDDGSFLLPDTAFGHSGMGGSLGFCDPATRLSFGYTMNRQGSGTAIDARCQSLVDAAYRSLA